MFATNDDASSLPEHSLKFKLLFLYMEPIHCSYAWFLIKYNIYNIHRWPRAYLTLLYTWDRIQYIYILYAHTGTSVHPLGKRFDGSDCEHTSIQRCTHNIVNHRVLSKGFLVVLLSIRRGIRARERDGWKLFDIGNQIQLYNNNNSIIRFGVSYYT